MGFFGRRRWNLNEPLPTPWSAGVTLSVNRAKQVERSHVMRNTAIGSDHSIVIARGNRNRGQIGRWSSEADEGYDASQGIEERERQRRAGNPGTAPRYPQYRLKSNLRDRVRHACLCRGLLVFMQRSARLQPAHVA